MIRAAISALFLVWTCSGSAFAEDYQHVRAERGSYGRVIHLYGDSIARGYGLGRFSEGVDTDDPLYAFRDIPSMIDLVFADNGIPDVATYDGLMFQGPGPDLEALEQAWASGTIRPDDVLVAEDAGPASDDPDAYEDAWWQWRQMATETHPITLLDIGMFDFPPAPPDSQYDRPLRGGSGRIRSRFQAVADATNEPMPYVGQSLFVDARQAMVRARASTGVSLMYPDGIHPNAWGQMLLAGEIMRAAGYGPRLGSVASARAIARANWQVLAYGSLALDADRAERYVERLLLGEGAHD